MILGISSEIQIEAVGFKGPYCEKASRFLEEAPGVVEESQKPENHQPATTENKQRVE
jgi:hypothetical protein